MAFFPVALGHRIRPLHTARGGNSLPSSLPTTRNLPVEQPLVLGNGAMAAAAQGN